MFSCCLEVPNVLRFTVSVFRKLSVVVDVSCDVTNPNNPLPFCDSVTSFQHPCKTLQLRYLIGATLYQIVPKTS